MFVGLFSWEELSLLIPRLVDKECRINLILSN